jgi:very-short-patch-repair endonuclease
MIRYNGNDPCVQCKMYIDKRVFKYSMENYRHPLCRDCQDWLEDILEYSSATDEAIDLYFALKLRDVPAKLEKSDGYKTIDIAVPHAKVNIEVDGLHHNYNVTQAMSDLKRILHSFKKGYITLHIPNSLARYNIEEAANLITEFLIESRQQHTKRP